jgi:hypothetical protein
VIPPLSRTNGEKESSGAQAAVEEGRPLPMNRDVPPLILDAQHWPLAGLACNQGRGEQGGWVVVCWF